ncbi:pollen receptor-like kinase 2 [Solanum dulcamara]|uniref:pollen receptor-like kinase 2 n=1 Tax=Solanum dulcamara TaxID=45834 RepID=UPI0024855361|nr:pollen receptor-like kinase 2 [Solanum dulcamara]
MLQQWCVCCQETEETTTLQVGFKEFSQTMKKIRNLKHQNVLPLVSYYSSNDEKMLIYKYQNSGSLLTLFKNYVEGKWNFPWKQRLSIAVGIARGCEKIFEKILSTIKELWEKLEKLYQIKSISNRLYLKKQFHKLQMDEGTTISDHLSVLNQIVSELESIRVKIDDGDKALRVIWSLPSSYKQMQPILMYRKEIVIFSEVTSKLISEKKQIEEWR